MVFLIFGGYMYLHYTDAIDESGPFSHLIEISFEMYIFSQFAIILTSLINKSRIDKYLTNQPIIENKKSLENLKPIARSNMYYALLHIPMLGVGALAAVVSILNYGLVNAGLVIAISVLTGRIVKGVKASEERIQQIECASDELEAELEEIIKCWLHKPLPNF
jgi:hypothetical protein